MDCSYGLRVVNGRWLNNSTRVIETERDLSYSPGKYGILLILSSAF